MPDNPEGNVWGAITAGINQLGSILGGGGGPAPAPVYPWAAQNPGGNGILPRDPDGTVDWETMVGLPDTDRASNGAVPGCQVTLPAEATTRFKAPRGYVIVYPDDPSGRTGTPVAMLKSVAKSCGLWRQPTKPPIKASDWRCLKKANSVVTKLDRVVKVANEVTGKPNSTRSRPKK